MLPTITLFGHEIAMYGVMCLTGILLAIGFSVLRAKKCGVGREDVLYMGILSAIGIVVGGKILYLLIDIPIIIKYSAVIFSSPETLVAYLSGGFVFYGGLFGAIFVIWFYCRRFKISFEKAMICMVPSFPVAHAIGRIGCYMAGCCYGVDGLPVQLYECFGNFVILGILLLVEKTGNERRIPQCYLFCYAVLRFILEFFRADAERGAFLLFSTSQWISIGVLICVGWLEYRMQSKKKKE